MRYAPGPAYQYVDDLIADRRYNANTRKMKSYISGLLDKKGKFTMDVFQWLNVYADKNHYIIDRDLGQCHC
jgi:hypothetical protein